LVAGRCPFVDLEHRRWASEVILALARAWCLRPLSLICMSPPPSNKLKAGPPLDLDLEALAGSSSFPSSIQARASTSPLAGRGGKGMGSRSAPASFVGGVRGRFRGRAVAQVCHLAGKRASANCSPGANDAFLSCCEMCVFSC
jgi:hypothetical protein